MYFVRLLKLKDVEIFKLKKEWDSNVISGFMLFLDFRRPSNLNDFPYLKEIEKEDDFGRSNYIKVTFFISKSIDRKDHYEELDILASSFLECMDDCHWNMDKIIVDDNFLESLTEDREKMLVFFENYIKEQHIDLNLKHITDKNFNYLSQD